MKHHLSKEFLLVAGLAMILSFAFLTSEVRAEEEVQPEPALYQERAQEREDRIEDRTIQKEERRSALEERVQDRIINLTSNVVARLTGAIDRFEQIINRFDSRIEKLNALEVDTVSADAKLDEAKTTFESLKIQSGNLPSVREAITGDSPREKFATIKTELKSIQNSLQQLHAQLREVVALLKEAVRSAELGRGVSDAVSNENSGSTEEETEE